MSFFSLNEEEINSLANLAFFTSSNNYLEILNNINKNFYDDTKHKIYLKLMKLYNDKYDQLIDLIADRFYTKLLNNQKIDMFTKFLESLSERQSNDIISKYLNKYNIEESKFYSRGDNFNIKLMNSIKKIKINKNNNYLKNNIEVLNKIYKAVNGKTIKFKDLKILVNDEKEITLEKLNILCILEYKNYNPNEEYENIINNYNEIIEESKTLSDYKEALKKYHSDSKLNQINTLDNIIKEIESGTYKDFDDEKKRKKRQNLKDELKDIVDKVHVINNSKIFKFLYKEQIKLKNNNISNEDSSKKTLNENEYNECFNDAYNDYIDFKQYILKNFMNTMENNNGNEKYDKIISESNKNKEIKEELLSITEGDEDLQIFLNNNEYQKDIKSIFYFLDKFERVIK